MPYDSVIDRSEASALIPEDVSREIIQSLPEYSTALRMFRKVPMSRAQQRMPVLSALAIAYFVTGGDTGLKQTTEINWTNKYLNAEEIAVIVPVSENVLDDTDYDIWGEVKPRLIEAIGRTIDAAIFFDVNRPSTWAGAIVTDSISAGNFVSRQSQSSTNDLAIEISNAMGLVEADGFMTNGYVSRVQLRTELRNLVDQNRQRLFIEGLQQGIPQNLYGDPLSFMKNGAFPAPASTVTQLITGDFNQGIIGLRKDITYKILDQAVLTDTSGNIIYNLAQQDMVALRCVMRLGWQVANPITNLNTNNSTRYPFAVVRQQ